MVFRLHHKLNVQKFFLTSLFDLTTQLSISRTNVEPIFVCEQNKGDNGF